MKRGAHGAAGLVVAVPGVLLEWSWVQKIAIFVSGAAISSLSLSSFVVYFLTQESVLWRCRAGGFHSDYISSI